MNTKLELLKKISGNDYVAVNEFQFKKANNAKVIVVEDSEAHAYVRERAFEEIPYLELDFLKAELPENFQSDLKLAELQELAKFDHTIISNHIVDPFMFTVKVQNQSGNLGEFVTGQEGTYTIHYEDTVKNYYLFFENENEG